MDLTTFTTWFYLSFSLAEGSGKRTVFKTTQEAETADIEPDENALNSWTSWHVMKKVIFIYVNFIFTFFF